MTLLNNKLEKIANERLIVALDYSKLEDVKNIVKLLGNKIKIYKVGLESFLNTNGEIIDYLHSENKKVFLDLKFHDIENTVNKACEYAIKKNVFMFNVHATNGVNTLKKIFSTLKENKSQSLLIAVTILTNLNNEDLKQIYGKYIDLEEIVMNLSDIAYTSGMNGIVCSSREAKKIKEKYGNSFITVCPGIRLGDSVEDDQKRTMTPYEAILGGADFLVIGRPITESENKIETVDMILHQIDQALQLN